ncbi:IMPACT family protein [Nesterenkonia lutea]|uniref:YigZ family protein n=1 Tax=Nesterenkonia lutea TaxID=272919 RepID=A0ABR9JDF8_9MICC|nr:YigZ family protein [Nesterenkonia lutea]MBE1523856.1 putative YigZ family protein [Nesterenkonia lutea]
MSERAESYTVLRPGIQVRTELERSRSRFRTVLCRAESEEDAQRVLKELRQANPTARHLCSAWVIGPHRSLQRSHDDGEPSGTAGAPILAALLRSDMPDGEQDLSDVLAVVLRWFGGTLLGSGGLVSAYSDSVLQALRRSRDQADLVPRVRMRRYDVHAPTAEAGRWENELRAAGVQVWSTDYSQDGSQARIQVSVLDSQAQIAELIGRISSLSTGGVSPTEAGRHWLDLPTGQR